MKMLSLILALTSAAAAQTPGQRSEDFTSDPGWEGYRNRLLPEKLPVTRQDFGYRTSDRAGGKKGEIGGYICRSVATPAYYAQVIATKTLNDKLAASGRFAVRGAEGGSGMLFGWFNEDSRGWRTPNSLAFRIDGNGGKYWVFYEYGTRHLLTGGGGAFEGERYQTTPTSPFAADGTVHRWTLSYDPQGAQGAGQIAFTIDDRSYTLPLPPGHKADGALLNRFGMFNQQTSGDAVEVYFDDLVVDGVGEDFSTDPGWAARNNEGQFAERGIRPLHDFGHSRSDHAGGRRGELGGIIWRDERPAYYGDRIGPLTLEHRLLASGKIAFSAAASDSGVYIGWFDSKSKKSKRTPEHQQSQKDILGVVIEGPSRVGHYFRPAYRTATGEGASQATGPIICPDGQVHEWSIQYTPMGAAGNGRITVKFDDHVQVLDLEPGHKQIGATFDRFGLFNIQIGGHYVSIFCDDLTYTARPCKQ